jgi:hypothetical protein
MQKVTRSEMMAKENWLVDENWEDYRQELLLKKVDLREHTHSYYKSWMWSTLGSAISLLIAVGLGLYIINLMSSSILGVEGLLVGGVYYTASIDGSNIPGAPTMSTIN